jgi:hypothetical protein
LRCVPPGNLYFSKKFKKKKLIRFFYHLVSRDIFLPVRCMAAPKRISAPLSDKIPTHFFLQPTKWNATTYFLSLSRYCHFFSVCKKERNLGRSTCSMARDVVISTFPPSVASISTRFKLAPLHFHFFPLCHQLHIRPLSPSLLLTFIVSFLMDAIAQTFPNMLRDEGKNITFLSRIHTLHTPCLPIP